MTDGPNDHMIGTVGVTDSEWESAADQSVEILKDDPVGASSDSETLDVRSEGRYKIVTETDPAGPRRTIDCRKFLFHTSAPNPPKARDRRGFDRNRGGGHRKEDV